MGLLNWFGKHRSKIPHDESRKEKISMLERTLEKGKKYEGDPFYEHRMKGILPQTFEYGMNCFLDRIAEQNGEEVAQKVYEELKGIRGGCTITTSALEDIAGIPVLFGVRSASVALEAYNKVAANLGLGKKAHFKMDKKDLVKLMLEGSNLELTFFQKTGPKSIHAILARPSDILLDSEPWFAKAVDLHKAAKYKEALENYNRAVDTEPLDGRAWLNKGSLLLELQKYEEAVECFDRVIDIAPKMAGGGAWGNKAKACMELKDYEKAVVCSDKALEINPNRAGIWNYKACSLWELKRYKEGVECINKAIELEPSEPVLWRNKADVLWSMGEYAESVQCCDKALDIEPTNAEVWNIKGLALTELGKCTEAVKCYEYALKASPEMDEALLNMAKALNASKEYEKALECIDAALGINPQHAGMCEILNDKTYALCALERYEEAIECCNKALKIDETSASSWHNKAIALVMLEKRAECCNCVNHALLFDPEFSKQWKELLKLPIEPSRVFFIKNEGIFCSERSRIDIKKRDDSSLTIKQFIDGLDLPQVTDALIFGLVNKYAELESRSNVLEDGLKELNNIMLGHENMKTSSYDILRESSNEIIQEERKQIEMNQNEIETDIQRTNRLRDRIEKSLKDIRMEQRDIEEQLTGMCL